jgi:hypothetical protein
VNGPCPDWRTLVLHRDPAAGAAEEPAGWPEALAHLDGCPACRRSAVEADPTLLFRRLPALSSDMSADAEALEVESMRQAVTAMRTARRLTPPRERAAWKRWMAAASLAAAALSLGADHGLRRATSATIAAVPAVAPRIALPVPIPRAPQAVPRFASEQVPMVEELNRPAARVYQMDGGKNLSVVMIVDERLDV